MVYHTIIKIDKDDEVEIFEDADGNKEIRIHGPSTGSPPAPTTSPTKTTQTKTHTKKQLTLETSTAAELRAAVLSAGLHLRARAPQYTLLDINKMKRVQLLELANTKIKGPGGKTVKDCLFQL